ncbi:precorrin-2 C(20)-methyltransferase [Clostridium guangxiense]|uniref:precorrin-2 C(20)-methyltransferase n=1 Tax=Clostridium guangxiense TaxID=1662055 RepID=UPI001E2E9758|nr:precorrin-2 C(20)-methyltransferase [Clostridium guangxiense]
MKKIYGVGVGPGDRELITLKGYRLIREAEVIFVPKSKGVSTALKIAEEFVSDKKIIELEFSMGEDNSESYKKAVEIIKETLGEVGIFLTLGDPMVYSTFIYLLRELDKIGIYAESIPGITSFGAASNRTKIPIAVKGDNFYLCDGKIDEDILEKSDSIAILKTYRDKEKIISKLEENNFEYAYVKRCTTENEAILYEKDKILVDKDYLSLIVGRRKSNG